jgi:hypothetical protein
MPIPIFIMKKNTIAGSKDLGAHEQENLADQARRKKSRSKQFCCRQSRSFAARRIVHSPGEPKIASRSTEPAKEYQYTQTTFIGLSAQSSHNWRFACVI